MMQRKPLFAASGAAEDFADVLESITDDDGAAVHAAACEKPQLDSSAVIQAERSIVGAILADNTLYDHVVETLRPDDFFDETARLLFALAGDILEGRVTDVKVVDPICLAMQPGVERLISLAGLTKLARESDSKVDVVTTRAKIVRDSASQRRLGVAAQKVQAIVGDDRPVEEKASDIHALLASAAEVKSLPVVSLGNAAIQALNQLAERAQNGSTGVGIPTGFTDLDAMLAGLHGGQLVVVAARPGVGKTAFAMSMGLSMARAGFHTLMASMEMKAMELSKRALSIVSGVDSHAIRMGALTEQEWIDVVAAGEMLNELPFNIVDLPSVDPSSLSGLCRRLHRAGKLHALIVDYLQIMKTLNARANREQQVAELSRSLKELAMLLDIPVIALSQLNRTVEQRADKRPQMSDLRESGAIEQDADVILFIHREDALGKGSALSDSKAEIIVGKQRAGAVGVVEALFRKSTTHFLDRSVYTANDPLLQIAA